MDSEKIEKIEVAKNNGNFYYTGILMPDPEDEGWVIIKTTRGEFLKFRKEQIMQRRKVIGGTRSYSEVLKTSD